MCIDNGLYQTFDLGVTKHTAVNSFGKFVEFVNPRHDKYWNPRLDLLQSRRDHCKKKTAVGTTGANLSRRANVNVQGKHEIFSINLAEKLLRIQKLTQLLWESGFCKVVG